MRTQHTPGPWLVNPLSAMVEVPDADAPICALLWPTELRSEGQTYANARLIAAAPELLELLSAVYENTEAAMSLVWMGRVNAVLHKIGGAP